MDLSSSLDFFQDNLSGSVDRVKLGQPCLDNVGVLSSEFLARHLAAVNLGQGCTCKTDPALHDQVRLG
jgi:hypothetical protein